MRSTVLSLPLQLMLPVKTVLSLAWENKLECLSICNFYGSLIFAYNQRAYVCETMAQCHDTFYAPGKPFQSSLLFVRRLLASPTNKGWKSLPETKGWMATLFPGLQLTCLG
jgi:hypothetical protein